FLHKAECHRRRGLPPGTSGSFGLVLSFGGAALSRGMVDRIAFSQHTNHRLRLAVDWELATPEVIQVPNLAGPIIWPKTFVSLRQTLPSRSSGETGGARA